ncbi:M4 family metallopeptidase [Actinopolymorpha alba]|uniref:M4 family metallopeptidase n=1 Tax=Actinopolymorpha alba TaxID=533267 RepID=UPI00035E18C8|nr:M4 family metallopeptidase [Actinopolymorpha alba]
MKYRRTVGGLAALATVVSGSALVALAAPSYAGSTTGPGFPGKTASDSSVKVLKGSDGSTSGVEAKGGSIALPKGTGGSPEDAAKSHVRRFASKLGVSADTLKPVTSAKVAGGNTVKLQQYINGVPVVAGEVVASLDSNGGLEALLGKTAKGAVESPKSLLSELKSQLIARRYVASKAKISAAGLRVESEGRWIYNPSLLGAPGAPVNRETFKFNVSTADHMVDYTVFVDPGFRSVAFAVSNNHEGLNRKVCDLNNKDVGTFEGVQCDGSTVAYKRTEGQPASRIADVDAVYDKLGETAKWYASYVNLDVSALVGGSDKSLKATTRVCATQVQQGCPLQNAFWSDGLKQMVYGQGFTTQDVTSHELTHGVTAHTSKLYYAYQSGALNESQSDVFGELVDLAANPQKQNTNAAWLIGDDMQGGAIRSMKDPTAFGDPDKMTSRNWNADPEFQDAGGVHSNSGVFNKTAYLVAQGGNFNGYNVRGLGLAKTFKIYWTVQNLLTSGSDAKDMFNALPLACKKNVGRAGTFINADDCAQVDKAVRATELYKDAPAGAPVATPYCNVGNVKASYSQGFDAKPSDWTLAGGAGLTVANFEFDYVNSGKDALGLFTETGRVNAASATSKAVKVPAASFLRIDYATLFTLYQPLAGASAVVEYSTNGSTWRSAGTLPSSVNGGPWTKHSNGWSSAKFNLATLSGQNVQFRIRMAGVSGDANNPVSLLTVDNFKIYSCG